MTQAELAEIVRRDGLFLRARGRRARAQLSGVGAKRPRPPGWDLFTDSWNDLSLDEYMADGGRYRLRRHAVLSAGPGAPRLEPPQPHYQSRDYNALNGGVARWFEPIAPAVVSGPAMARVLDSGCALFGRLRRARSWKIEAHQFRIEAKNTIPGQPDSRGHPPRRGRFRARRPGPPRERGRAVPLRFTTSAGCKSLGSFTLTGAVRRGDRRR